MVPLFVVAHAFRYRVPDDSVRLVIGVAVGLLLGGLFFFYFTRRLARWRGALLGYAVEVDDRRITSVTYPRATGAEAGDLDDVSGQHRLTIALADVTSVEHYVGSRLLIYGRRPGQLIVASERLEGFEELLERLRGVAGDVRRVRGGNANRIVREWFPALGPPALLLALLSRRPGLILAAGILTLGVNGYRLFMYRRYTAASDAVGIRPWRIWLGLAAAVFFVGWGAARLFY